MAAITVLRPDEPQPPPSRIAYATRGALPAEAHLILIENGKPRARDLMLYVAEGMRQLLPIATVEVHSKPSTSQPIDPDEAKEMAARAHLVITGVGD